MGQWGEVGSGDEMRWGSSIGKWGQWWELGRGNGMRWGRSIGKWRTQKRGD